MEPIAVFSLVCKAGFYNMYNALGYGCFRLDSPNEAYGPQAQKSMKPANARGYWVSAAPTLKAKVWRLILMNTTTINQLALNGSGYFSRYGRTFPTVPSTSISSTTPTCLPNARRG